MGYLKIVFYGLLAFIERHPIFCFILLLLALFAPFVFKWIGWVILGIIALALIGLLIMSLRFRKMKRQMEDQMRQASGGFAGSTLMLAARYGIARGLFSNESGLGSAPIVAAAAQTRNPVRQALVSSTGTFWDTVIICALTGLVITSSIIAYPDIDYHDGAALTKAAFSKIPYIGAPLLTFGLTTFAFSTTLGWSYYGERCVEYLKGKKWMLCYRILYIASIFAGSVISLGLVWNIADCMNALMAIPNLVSLLCLSGIIVHETRKYLWRHRLDQDMEESELQEVEDK